jgi:hypothetical protein
LNYSSQSGNGIAGMGWNLSGLSVITRCAATQATDGVRGGVNLDANDKLCLDGQRLIVQSGTYGQPGAVYLTEIFNGSRITQVGTVPLLISRTPVTPPVLGYTPTAPLGATRMMQKSTAASVTSDSNVEFRVETKAGELMEYSRADPWGGSSAPTRMWLLTRVVDAHGNYWYVNYNRDSANGEYNVSDINYTGNVYTGLLAYNKVDFVYDPRPDPSMAYLGGLPVTSSKRLKTIRTWATPSAGGAMQAVTEYRLTYGTSVGTGRSLLQSVQEFAADGTALNPITFTYNTAAPSFAVNGSAFGTALSDANAWNSGYRFWSGDVNGDGRTDIITRDSIGVLGILQGTPNGMAWVSNNSATGVTDTSLATSGNNFFAGDFNGDGRTDLLYRDPSGNFTLFVSNGTGFSNAGVMMSSAVGLSDAYGWNASSRFFPMDVNGDGRMDLVARKSDGTLLTYLSNGTSFTYAGPTSTPYSDTSGLNNFYIADFDGDGKMDLLVRDKLGNLNVWLSNGATFVQGWTTQANIPADPYYLLSFACPNFNAANRMFIADVNGDGKADVIVRAPDGTFTVWLSTGKGFVAQPSFQVPCVNCADLLNNPAPAAYTDSYHAGGMEGFDVCGYGNDDNRFFFTDVNGDGRADLIVRRPTGEYELWLSNGSTFTYNNVFSIGAYADGPWSGGYRYWSSDATGDGKGGMIARDYAGTFSILEPVNAGCVDCIASAKGSLGLTTTISYESLSTSTRYSLDSQFAATVRYPQQIVQPPLYIVGSATSDNAVGTQNTTSYWYGTALNSADGRGFLGFHRFESVLDRQPLHDSIYFAQYWPFTGLPMHVDKWQPNGAIISATYNNYQADNTSGLTTSSPNHTPCLQLSAAYPFQLTAQPGGACTGTVNVFNYQINTYAWDLDGTELPATQTSTQVDAYGNPLTINAQTLNPGSRTFTGYSRTTTNTYKNDPTNWWIGRLTKSAVQSVRPASN